MVSMTVELRNVEGTEAAMGWAGGHTIIVDRPPGKAGGLGLRLQWGGAARAGNRRVFLQRFAVCRERHGGRARKDRGQCHS